MQVKTLVLGELGTNCYIVSDEVGQAIIIDPADDADAILECVKKNHLTVLAVVLTHAHFDHMMAAEAVCTALDVPLYVGDKDGAAMTDANRNLSGWFADTTPIHISDFQVITEGESISVGEVGFTVIETPGHTPGCICLYREGHLFVGDTLFEDSIGRLDFPGGNPQAMLKSLQRLMELPPDTIVYPGHGPSTTIGREIRHNPYLQ